MPLVMPAKGSDFSPPPEGNHVAVCFRVVDLGTQETSFKGEAKRAHQILISWELPEEKMDDGRPFTIGRKYTYSSSTKSNLRKDLESWRGKPFEDWELGEFDIGKLLGAGCMLNVMHEERNGNTYANIKAIARLPKGLPTPTVENPPVCFSLSDRPFSRAVFEMFGERLREIIAKSPEYRSAVEGRNPRDEPPPANEGDYGGRDLDDEIPF